MGMWRDLKDTKFTYVMLVVGCLVVGGIIRDDNEDDERSNESISTEFEDVVAEVEEVIERESGGDTRGDIEERFVDALIESAVVSVVEEIEKSQQNSLEEGVSSDEVRQRMTEFDIRDGIETLKDFENVLDLAKNAKVTSADWKERQRLNSDYIFSIANATLLGDVIDALGQPDFRHSYGNDVELLLYRVRNIRTDLLTTPDETAVLVFHLGALIGFDDSKDWFGGNRTSADPRNYQEVEKFNLEQINTFELGVERNNIIRTLGEPDFVDSPGRGLEIVSYRTQTVLEGGYTSRVETTALLLKDDKLFAKLASENQ